jgi:transposase
LIPRVAGDRVKTDRRDCRRLARLHRAGELRAIRVPSVAEEGVRDLCRARTDLVIDRRRARQRLGGFSLRHGRVYRAGAAGTQRHRAWLEGQRFDDPAVARTHAHYLAVLTEQRSRRERYRRRAGVWFAHPLFADSVAGLAAYRGVDALAALVLATEVCDWRRFATAGEFMGFCGLVPSEYSSGAHVRRGKLTKAGNVAVRTQLVESAWAYQFPARVTREIARRHEGPDPQVLARAWRAQPRLSRRFRTLAARKDSRSVVAAAIARELAGFVWAEMTA